MPRQIASVPELWTDGIEDLGGGAFAAKFHMRVVFVGEDPAGEWHYYGTVPPPEHVSAVRHDQTHFPFALTQTQDRGLLFDLAIAAERTNLEA